MLCHRTRSFNCPTISESRSAFDNSLSSITLLKSSEEKKTVIDIIHSPSTPQRDIDEDPEDSKKNITSSVIAPPWGSHQNSIVGNEWNLLSKVQSTKALDTQLSFFSGQPYTMDNKLSDCEVVSDPFPQCNSEYDRTLLVPSPIPQELQALVDAYVFGKPLTVITSSQRFYDIWSFLLPNGYGYVMLGFFRILGVQVRFYVACPAPLFIPYFRNAEFR